ncbi:uncharacterized protein C20orf96 homolog isoform X3 [Tachyglossus aculeatus]|uniref:uncharacterized protein C20orf96 homolog isoform X3 n=1 Tax=Tachyglossus aculeatus TaxID=9261 RepID=UPI0018F6A14A|nr:uncharacterized protein C20orf96 homolog isoform X3 [Tachyglossus aculeatus]
MEARIGNLGGFRRPRDRGAPGLNPPRPWLSLSLGLEQDPHPSPEPKVPGRPPLPPIHAGHARPGGRTAAAPHHNAGPPAPSGRRTHPKALAGADLDPVRLHEANQILRLMLKARQSSLEEVKGQARVLRKANRALAESTRRTETLLVDHVRELLQQQDLFGTMIATLESSNQMQLHIAKRQLAETEEREKAKMEVLQRQLSQLRARNRKSQEELNVLLAYMDQDFPLKAVQISGLLRQVQQLKDAQQDESEELRLMRRTVLGSMERKAAEAQEKILRRLANDRAIEASVPSRSHRRRSVRTRRVWPRRPRPTRCWWSRSPTSKGCEPDTDVCLDFPREERLPF